jgi:ribosome maturation protein Sdo1
MTAVTESDLKRLEDLIVNRFDELARGQKALESQIAELKTAVGKIENTVADLQKDVVDLKIATGKIEVTLQSPFVQKLPDVVEKMGELKNWKQTGLIILTAFVSSIFSSFIGGVIGWLIRGSRFNP